MKVGAHGRIVAAAYIAAAVLLSGALAAVGAGIVVISSRPAPWFTLTPELLLLAGYLVAPLVIALLSLGGWRGPATGVRKFVLAGIAADLPAALVLIVAFLLGGESWLPFVIGGAFAVVVLLVPSGRCFDAAYELARGERSRALHETRLTPYVIGIPAAVATGLAAPAALTGLQPCELCLQAFLALAVLAGYAVPALVAALLAASARHWLTLVERT